jgi:hypothetical protein
VVTAPIMIVTPIWQPVLREMEAAFLRVTNHTNASTPRAFVAPQGMSTQWYEQTFPDWQVRRVDDRHLASVANYSAWMTSADPYRLFDDVSMIVVCQTDAVLTRSVQALDVGAADFLGAPWSPPVRVLRAGHRLAVYSAEGGGPWYARAFGKRLWVGNGGLSVRNTAAFECAATQLAARFPAHYRSRVNEDVYFATVGPQVGLAIADRSQAASVFAEAAAQHMHDSQDLWGFHALERWNPTLAQHIIESIGEHGVT